MLTSDEPVDCIKITMQSNEQKIFEQRVKRKAGAKKVLPRALLQNEWVRFAFGTSLDALQMGLGDCQRCGLCKTRTHIVFGEGSPEAKLMFVGEGPGESEDLQGRPFVGRSGQLLTKMIEAMGLSRSDVYIANVVKCRPPENRVPEREEVATCKPFLLRQIEIIQPKILVTLGATSLSALLGEKVMMTKVRGVFQNMTLESGQTVQVMPTFHPAYLLRNPPAKKEVWADLQLVMQELGLKNA